VNTENSNEKTAFKGGLISSEYAVDTEIAAADNTAEHEMLSQLKKSKEFSQRIIIRPYNEVHELLQKSVDESARQMVKEMAALFPLSKG